MGEKREFSIDFIRGLSVFFIIMIHFLSIYKGTTAFYIVWDYLHFVVIAIIFCSGASLNFSYPRFNGFISVMDFIKKRLYRLIVNWWFFLFIYFLIQFSIGAYSKLSLNYILNSFFLFGVNGGVGYGWLILLILSLSFSYPLLLYLKNKLSISSILVSLIIFSFLFSFFIIKYMFVNKEIVFFLPVMFVFFMGMCYNWFKKRMNFLWVSVFSFVIFIVYRLWLIFYDKSVILIDNKFPPNFFYISYGLFVLFLLLYVFQHIEIENSFLSKGLVFFSKNSLWLYLWHILALDLRYVIRPVLINNSFAWIFEFMIVMGVCVILVLLQNFFKSKLKEFTKK